jgi:biopolymer transport protein TolQ
MANELSIWGLIINASWIVKVVMLLLLIASIWSWTMVFQKTKLLKITQLSSDKFHKTFWSGPDMNALFRSLKGEHLGLSAIFHAGFQTFLKWQDTKASATQVIENVERAMRVAFMRESDRLETQLPFLATIGSVSPYVGLFGTVWGIMSAFVALGGVEQATLSMVAPGIAEALIATAMGLFVAIPAVIFYNRFLANIEPLLNEYENFQDEFVNILERQLSQPASRKSAS